MEPESASVAPAAVAAVNATESQLMLPFILTLQRRKKASTSDKNDHGKNCIASNEKLDRRSPEELNKTMRNAKRKIRKNEKSSFPLLELYQTLITPCFGRGYGNHTYYAYLTPEPLYRLQSASGTALNRKDCVPYRHFFKCRFHP